MKKSLLYGLALVGASILAGISLTAAGTPESPTDFSGDWVLDFSQSRNLPLGLRNYSLSVSQDEAQLKVESALEGELKPAPDADVQNPGRQGGGRGSDPSGSSYPGSGRRGGIGLPGVGGIGFPGGGGGAGGPMGEGIPGGGQPSGGGGRSRGESHSQAEIAALNLYPHTAVYHLDGSPSTTQLGGNAENDATLKAERAKSGKEIKLSVLGSGDGGKVELKDQWKLSKDGRYLMVDRAVKSPSGSGTVHLVFRKQAGDSDKGAS